MNVRQWKEDRRNATAENHAEHGWPPAVVMPSTDRHAPGSIENARETGLADALRDLIRGNLIGLPPDSVETLAARAEYRRAYAYVAADAIWDRPPVSPQRAQEILDAPERDGEDTMTASEHAFIHLVWAGLRGTEMRTPTFEDALRAIAGAPSMDAVSALTQVRVEGYHGPLRPRALYPNARISDALDELSKDPRGAEHGLVLDDHLITLTMDGGGIALSDWDGVHLTLAPDATASDARRAARHIRQVQDAVTRVREAEAAAFVATGQLPMATAYVVHHVHDGSTCAGPFDHRDHAENHLDFVVQPKDGECYRLIEWTGPRSLLGIANRQKRPDWLLMAQEHGLASAEPLRERRMGFSGPPQEPTEPVAPSV